MNLLKNVKITRVMNAVAAGTTDQESTGVDMTGFDGVMFIAAFGAITGSAVTSINAAQSSDDGSVDDYTDLASTSIAVADSDDNKVAVLDIYRPTKRYVRCHVDRATQNAVIDGVFAIQYQGRTAPVVQPTSVLGSETHVSPAEGTA